MFPTIVYTLCFLTSSACAFLLGRSYMRTGGRLLLWSALCFFFLACNNLVVILDMLLIREINFQLLRVILALAGVSVLLFGLIWEREEGA